MNWRHFTLSTPHSSLFDPICVHLIFICGKFFPRMRRLALLPRLKIIFPMTFLLHFIVALIPRRRLAGSDDRHTAAPDPSEVGELPGARCPGARSPARPFPGSTDMDSLAGGRSGRGMGRTARRRGRERGMLIAWVQWHERQRAPTRLQGPGIKKVLNGFVGPAANHGAALGHAHRLPRLLADPAA